MTATTELMAQLQAAWQLAALHKTTTEFDQLPHDGRMPVRNRCISHVDPADWIRTPIPGRPGWVQTHCGRCGVFIGNAPESQVRTLASQDLAVTDSSKGPAETVRSDH